MLYYKLRTQPDSENRRVEYYCTVQGNIYSKLLSTGEMKPVKPFGDCHGYLKIKIDKCLKVHRLVWEAIFGPIPTGLTVDHIDGDKTNNKITNLQLLPLRDNVKKANDVPVDMLDLEGKFIRVFPSMSDAARWLQCHEFPRAAQCAISFVCRGIYKQAYGFKWRYHNG